jgi:hypothetical protein
MSKSKEVEFIQAVTIQKMLDDWFGNALKEGNDFVKGFLIFCNYGEEGRDKLKDLGGDPYPEEAGFDLAKQLKPFAEKLFQAWILGLIQQVGR